MPFLHPAIAGAAFAVAAIPIIIHLLNRRRLRKLDWAAMEFLLAALKRTRRRVRIEQLILLMVRIAMMIVLALFLARPMLSDSEFSWLASALKKEEKIFVLDDSLSMARRHTDGNVFDRAADAVSTELNRLGRRRAGDIVSLMRASQSDTPPPGVFINQESSAELEQTVKSFTPTSTRMDVAKALESIAQKSATATTGGPQHPRSISIVTDLRSVDWTDGAGGPSEAISQALTRLSSNEENAPRIIIYDVGSDDTSNVAITEVALEGGKPTVGIPTEVRVKVRNFGRDPVSAMRLQMSFGAVSDEDTGAGSTGTGAVTGTALAPSIERLQGGETTTASIPCTFRKPGQYWAKVEVSGSGSSGNRDSLPEDNTLSFVVDVVEATDVLLISGEPSSERWEGETDFLVSVLDPDGEAKEGIRPTITSEDNPPEESLDKFVVIYLANVHSLPEAFRRRVGRYVRDGGSLVIFLGDQVDQAEYLRQFGVADGPADDAHPWRDLLPARLTEITGGELTNVGLSPSYEHPYFRNLRGEAEPYLQQVSFHKYWTLEPLPTTRILARFEDGSESPAIVERAIEDGRVILFASSADDEWHDWPRNGTFVVLQRDILESIARARGGAEQRLAGDPIELPIDVSKHKLEARFRAPDYPRTPEGTLRAAPKPASSDAATGDDSSGDFQLSLDRKTTLASGLFRLALSPRGGGDDEWRAVAIRSDPAESDMTRITASGIEELYPDFDIRVIQDSKSFTEAGRGQFEIADILIAIFVLLLFLEGILACWFAHHNKAAGSGQLAGAGNIPAMKEGA